MNNAAKKLKSNINLSIITVLVVMAIVSTLFCTRTLASSGSTADEKAPSGAHSEKEKVDETTTKLKVEGLKFALIAASVAFGLGALGAGIA